MRESDAFRRAPFEGEEARTGLSKGLDRPATTWVALLHEMDGGLLRMLSF